MTEQEHDEDKVPAPEGRAAWLPYDWRKPTVKRVAARLWNPDDPHLFTPKVFGWGYTLNFYWLVHFGRYLRARSSR